MTKTTKMLNIVATIILHIILLTGVLHAQDFATVIRVIDGDTLKINYQDKEQSIRLIGIDTPESKANKKANKDAMRSGQDIATITAMGKQATAFVKKLVKAGCSTRK